MKLVLNVDRSNSLVLLKKLGSSLIIHYISHVWCEQRHSLPVPDEFMECISHRIWFLYGIFCTAIGLWLWPYYGIYFSCQDQMHIMFILSLAQCILIGVGQRLNRTFRFKDDLALVCHALKFSTEYLSQMCCLCYWDLMMEFPFWVTTWLGFHLMCMICFCFFFYFVYLLTRVAYLYLCRMLLME